MIVMIYACIRIILYHILNVLVSVNYISLVTYFLVYPSHFINFNIFLPVHKVRPKPEFLRILQIVGAKGEVFTKKEVGYYITEFIMGRENISCHYNTAHIDKKAIVCFPEES